MKYCTKCGNELFDYAAVCPKCGFMVEQPQTPPQSAPYTQNAYAQQTPYAQSNYAQAPVAPQAPIAPQKKSIASTIFCFISDLISIFSVLFLVCGLASVWVDADLYITKYSSYGVDVSAYLRYDDSLFVMAMMLAITAFAMALTSLIMAIVKRNGVKAVLASVTRLVLTSTLTLLPTMFFIF